ncbi:MAG: PocR ligand-binding domain-containing protein, partial [Bacteroidales bacterium]|nr:PocR ligand-binding domain-containing protein [Bacteroidales bacterium]
MTPFTQEEFDLDLNNIQFSDIFVLEEIQQMQDLFSNATGVASLITNTEGIPITRPSNFCRLCNDIIRNTEKGRINCYRSDSTLGRSNQLSPVVRTCLSGDLWDAGVSITVGGKHIANWLVGQVRSAKSNRVHMMKYAEEIGADKEAYIDAFNEVPVMTFEHFNNVASMLFQFVNELSDKAYSNLLLKAQITEREKVTAMLQKSEKKYRLLVDNCNDVIYTLDFEGKMTFVSPVWTSLLGYDVNQSIGKYYYEFIHPDDIPTFENFLKKLNESDHSVQNVEFRIKHHDGYWCWYLTGGLPIKDEKGNVTGFYGTLKDIGEKKKNEDFIKSINEELINQNTVKDRFFSIIAHDLRSPLCSILGLSKLIAEDTSDFTTEQIQEITSNIHITADNLYHLLENLLEWAKIQQNLIFVDLEPVKVLFIVQESVLLFTDTFKNKNLKIAIDISKEVQVYADINIMKTIVRNLISNAIKFTPKGGNIEISTKMTKEDEVEISIKDSGIGMGPEILKNLFRLDVSTCRKGTENESSTGFGLLLCKEFIEKLGGKISVESECGKGSNFHFSLPKYP